MYLAIESLPQHVSSKQLYFLWTFLLYLIFIHIPVRDRVYSNLPRKMEV